MNEVTQAAPSVDAVRAAGLIAVVIGVISAVGVVLLIAMFILFGMQRMELGKTVGRLNDICVAAQYLLTIPVALVLYPLLRAYHPGLMRAATAVGVAAMLAVAALQILLIFNALTFEQQVPWVAAAMILGVGFWLVVTGLAARSTGKLPHSLLMSGLAVPYFGYPAWAFWLGARLLAW